MTGCPSCSQNAHGETVLAWDKSASRRARGWAGEKVAHTQASIRPHPSLSQALSEKLNVPVFRPQTWTWLLQIDLIGRAPSAAERNEHTLIREILQIPRRRGL